MEYSKYNRYEFALESTCLSDDMLSKFWRRKNSRIKGNIRLETGNQKAIINCQVENLKHYEKSQYLYKLILLGKKNGKAIFANCGTIDMNPQGKGHINYNFNPSTIGPNQSGLHEFSSVIIASISTINPDETMYPVLFAGLPMLDSTAIQPEVVDVASFFNVEKPTVKAARHDEPPKNYNSYYNEFLKISCDNMHKVIDLYEKVYPFGDALTDIRWYRVTNIMSLPFINTSYSFAVSDYFKTNKSVDSNTFISCQDLSSRHRHFIFGIKDNDDRKSLPTYYFGIPGLYKKEDQPDGGKSGFTYWQRVATSEGERTGYGYWLIGINGLDGKIMEINSN